MRKNGKRKLETGDLKALLRLGIWASNSACRQLSDEASLTPFLPNRDIGQSAADLAEVRESAIVRKQC